ncbi:MAG: NAD-dependent epimerase/dehydratase family protein, partial [Candidatus Lokiarchaeota archaeon]|nr:NAD-dependent epimerase/dehydratase family protein [Candidatus Lokiarchaeota archaeon]
MKILVTGSAGFIGSALREFLEEQEIDVIPFDIKDNLQ